MKCKKLLSLALAVCMTFGSAAVLPQNSFIGQTDITASAEGFTELTYEVTFQQEDARSMLSLVNEFRHSDEAWAWDENNNKKYYNDLGDLEIDYELEKAAMQRAAELVAYYSHTRPNGEDCFTAYPESFSWSFKGENIAIGYRSVEAMFEGWKEDDNNYSGQGHRRAMLSPDYKAIAIAHVKYAGMDYWVQEFSSKTVDTTYKAPNNSSTPVTVSVSDDMISKNAPEASPSYMNIYDDQNYDLPEVTRNIRLGGQWHYAPDVKLDIDYSWKIKSGSDVVKLSDSKIIPLNAGSAVITATCSDGQTIDVIINVTHSHVYTETVVPGTCVSQGYTLYKCKRCDYSYTGNYTSYGDHSWREWETTQEPTCTKKGIKTRTCKYCQREDSEYVDALGHDYAATVVKPTCTKQGYTMHKCSRCGDSYKDTYKDATGHSWSKWTTTKKATCTADGSKTRTCSVCKKTETATIAKLGHDYVTTVVKPTCTAKGYTLHKCSRCGDSYKDTYKDATGHSWSKWTTTKKATCTADGSKTRTCSVCKKTETAAIAKLGHDYAATVVKPTCTKQGYTMHKCSRCGDSYKDTYKDATGHSWSKWTTTKKATCTTDGTQTRKCSVCGKTETKTIKATGHKLTATPAKAATCTTNGNKAYWYCSTCKKYFSDKNGKTEITKASTVVKAAGHKFSDWTTTSFNVDKGTSTQKHTCSVCKKPETRTVKNSVVRYAGANRYDTAAMLSKASHKTTSDTVIIADAMTFQDALIAVPLAKAYNAPLLLANPNIVTKQTEAELARLKAKKVIIVNTNNALQKGTLDALKNKYTTQIIRGNNCFETSKRVAEELQKKTKKAPTDVFFTTNKAFADALSISPVAALKGAPILYVDPSKKTLDSNILAYLKKVKGSIKNVYIVGGTVAVPKAIENSIKKALPKKNVKRFNGAQRYETCVMINKYFASLLNSKTVCVAKGLDFPDALAGGVFAANQKAPLLLADSVLRDAHKSFLKDKKPNKLYIFGGTVAVPDKLAKEVAKMSV